MRPLFENDRAGKISPPKAFQEPTDARVISSCRSGEQRQVRVCVSPVLVKVKVNDGQSGIEFVEETQVIVVGRGAKVGVAQIEAHAYMVRRNVIKRAKTSEQLIKVLRRVIR